MEAREYRENFRNLILDMAYKELENYTSQKGAKRFFEVNVDRVINENLRKNQNRNKNEDIYLKMLVYGSYQENLLSIGKLIKKEEFFKSKKSIYNFAKYLNLNVNKKLSYNQILRIISKYIYDNRNLYSSRYVIYKSKDKEYILEPQNIKNELIQNYKSKTREDMKEIARILDVDVNDSEGAEDIRKKIINNIIKEKLRKNK